jgi:4-alpha-glucanotransferase
VLVPLFSLVSHRSWGVGEFLDLPAFARWGQSAGQSFVQVLPMLEIPDHQTSPYSALTAMALDPIYISIEQIDDFQALGGVSQFSSDDRDAHRALVESDRVQHRAVRALKGRWLRRCYARFLRDEASARSPRCAQFEAFARREAWWLDDYALFRALRGVNEQRAWWEWPAALAKRDEEALARARDELAPEVGYREYVQWIAAEQWERARREAAPVQVFGDVPFMISTDSPDVWCQQNEFRFDATVGVPPDAFSETGQDWGLPPWRWDAMRDSDFDWMRRRARRSAALFDGFRLDHLVGFYRTFVRPTDAGVRPFFAPADEPTQTELGERLVRIYQESGAEVIAEDLGLVPDFVRASLRRLGVPGFKVLRWERYWSQPEQPFIDPKDYDEISVATSGTHDTETLVAWWETLPQRDREDIVSLPTVAGYLASAGHASIQPGETLAPEILDAVIHALLASGSRFVIVPIQDLFGWADRINTPATVDEANWSWRLPWTVDCLEQLDVPRARAAQLREWTRETGRDPVSTFAF